jgi:hypothetical protein
MPPASIPISLLGQAPGPEIEVDATRIARGLGLEAAAFRQLMADRKVTVLCERGTGEDEGRWRASFYWAGRRVRLVVDAAGAVLGED